MARSRRTMLKAGMALPFAAAPAGAGLPDPDARLLTLCADYTALDRRFIADTIRLDGMEWDTLDSQALEQQLDNMVVEFRRLASEISALPAQTPAGIRAKAAAARRWLAAGGDSPDGWKLVRAEDALMWSLVQDVLGRV